MLFFCKAGKDRTGLVAAMMLTLMGASRRRWRRGRGLHLVVCAGEACAPVAALTWLVLGMCMAAPTWSGPAMLTLRWCAVCGP